MWTPIWAYLDPFWALFGSRFGTSCWDPFWVLWAGRPLNQGPLAQIEVWDPSKRGPRTPPKGPPKRVQIGVYLYPMSYCIRARARGVWKKVAVLAEIGRNWPKSPDFGQKVAKIADFRPKLAKIGQKWPISPVLAQKVCKRGEIRVTLRFV